MDVHFLGDGNSISIYKNTNFEKCAVLLGSKMKICLGKTKYTISNMSILAKRGVGGSMEVGEDFSCVGAQFLFNEAAGVRIGDDCMFSANIYVWASDGHAIIDCNSRICTNKADRVVIGDHCWVAENARILKNVVMHAFKGKGT